ncbi:hypothetical protein C9374_000863 [Naegleria lovaniensis]|uniref:Dual specificity phosphatase n=1 Tax=Naegleria lovaniensis TaxID=51637 RepID=A0AA88KMW9_NAELO|nr:uncharacterized protein C9374_000863 [Naegleria lovaniensis]KAG2388013.1 hypothetical protein C9374_000863 [Naegleria lovaniensis]
MSSSELFSQAETNCMNESSSSPSSSPSSSSEPIVNGYNNSIQVSEEEQVLDQQALKLCEHALAGPITFHIHTCHVEPIPLHFNDINGMTCLEFYNQVMMKLEKEYQHSCCDPLERCESTSHNDSNESSINESSINESSSSNNNSNESSSRHSNTTTNESSSSSSFTTIPLYLKDICINDYIGDKPLREFLSESLLKIEQNVYDLQVLYQDHPPQSLELQLPLHVKNRNTQSIVDQIEQFISMPYDSSKPLHRTSQLSSYNFSTEMSVLDRKFIHAISSLYGIYHKSEGNAQQRFIKISKEATTQQTTKKKRKEPNFPSGMSTVIENFLYLGSGLDANDEIQIKKNQIDYILNVTKEWPIGKSIPSYIVYKRISLKDEREESIIPYFEQAFEFIEQALEQQKRILVHCVIGKSRSASFVLAFLMKHFNFNLKQAYDYLKERRELIRPNDGFIMQLMEYEYKLHQGQFTKVNIQMDHVSEMTTLKSIHIPQYLSTSLEWEFKETKQEKAIREKEMRKSKLSEEEEAELERTFLNDEKLNELLNECFPPSRCDEMTSSCNNFITLANNEQRRPLLKSQVQQFVKFVNTHPIVIKHHLFENANFMKFVHHRCAKWFISQCSSLHDLDDQEPTH